MMCIPWARALLVLVSFVGICTSALPLDIALGNLQANLGAFEAKINEIDKKKLNTLATARAAMQLLNTINVKKDFKDSDAFNAYLVEAVLKSPDVQDDVSPDSELLYKINQGYASHQKWELLHEMIKKSNRDSGAEWDNFFELLRKMRYAIIERQAKPEEAKPVLKDVTEALQAAEALKKATIAVSQVWEALEKDAAAMKWVFDNGRSSLLRFDINFDGKMQTISAILGWSTEGSAKNLQEIETNHYKDYDANSQVEWAEFTKALDNAWDNVKNNKNLPVLKGVTKELDAAISKANDMAFDIAFDRQNKKIPFGYRTLQTEQLWLEKILENNVYLLAQNFEPENLKATLATFNQPSKKKWEQLQQIIIKAIAELKIKS